MEDLKRIFKFMKPCRREFFLAVMFVIIEASFELTIPMLMADMIDVGVADRDMDYIVARGLTMMACALLALVTGLLYARFSARAANGLEPLCGRRSTGRFRNIPLKTWITLRPRL